MIDFDKFKAKMCNAKAAFEKEKNLNDAKLSNSEMLMSRNDLDMAKERAIFDKLMGESVTSDEHGWKKRLDVNKWKDDIKINIYAKK